MQLVNERRLLAEPVRRLGDGALGYSAYPDQPGNQHDSARPGKEVLPNQSRISVHIRRAAVFPLLRELCRFSSAAVAEVGDELWPRAWNAEWVFVSWLRPRPLC